MDLNAYLAKQSLRVENYLTTLFEEHSLPYNTLFKAARYSLLSGGKRLRPILALATTETLGGNIETAIRPACALECIHTYSLIHDDLPCMDDDDFRRGKPSLHKVFPEGHAVLTGDFLLTHAFDILANDSNLNVEKKLKLISILSNRSGGHGMIAGQVMDLEAEGQEINLEHLRLIHSKKTGAMITASIEFGGVIVGAPPSHMGLLRQFGEEIGLAFQIVDDILDATEGKKGSDVAKDKATYVAILGLERSRALAEQALGAALAALKKLPQDTSLLKQLAQHLVHRKS